MSSMARLILLFSLIIADVSSQYQYVYPMAQRQVPVGSEVFQPIIFRSISVDLYCVGAKRRCYLQLVVYVQEEEK